MPSLSPSIQLLIPCLLLLVLHARPSHAFGAGNIASTARIEGQNWRHGDIEDTLLTLLISRAAGGEKFSKMDVKRVYFGNWLRDYSQAVDVGTVKMVSAEAIRILLWVLGFLTFGYGTKEFEVTTDRLGCYRPEEHIDNPKDYAENIDARQYDRRLRGPVDERTELAIDPRSGLKNYIASEHLRIATSAGLVRNLFGRSIQLGRDFARSGDRAQLYEALRLLGTACHCLEDYSAHSNYTELALIELGERDVFPHVGRDTMVRVEGARGPVYPLVTGTFGGVDFLHSVMGEVSDKATQSEIQELEGTISQSQGSGANTSMLRDLLDQLPDGLLGGEDQAGKADQLQQNATTAQMQNTRISPREPEAWTQQMHEISKQIYPVMEWHDELMKSISETIESIPVLPELIEQFQEQINVFVFSLIAPFVLPIINQVKTELSTGSSEIIQSSREKQLIVFYDDRSSDPTHSMLSKDHFSNVLNEPAGKIASQVLRWVVPQIIACWDDERVDVNRTINRVVGGVFHHPALHNYGEDGAVDGRRQMFGVVQQWWEEQPERERQGLREQLSREGVENGRNHKPGVHDKGHGCGKPLGMPGIGSNKSSGGIGGTGMGGDLGQVGKMAGEAVGGGALGGLVGGIVGAAGSGLLGGAFASEDAEQKSYSTQSHGRDGSYTQTQTQTGRLPSEGRYGQAEYSQTSYPGGGQREEYRRYEQPQAGYGGQSYGVRQVQETTPSYGGGYEQRTEATYERPGGQWESEQRFEGRSAGGEEYSRTSYNTSQGYGQSTSGAYVEDSDEEKKRKKREKKERKKREKKHKKHHDDDDSEDDDDDDDDDSDDDRPKRSQGYGSSGYGGGSRETYSSEPRREESYGAYGSTQQSGYRSTPGAFDDDSSSRPSYGGGRGDSTEYRAGYGEERTAFGGGYEARVGQLDREEGFRGSRAEEYGESVPGAFGGGDEYSGGQSRGYGGGGSDEYGGGGGEQEQTYGGGGDEYNRGSEQSYGGNGGNSGSGGYGYGDDERRERGYGNDY
ncbi:MAG: hypothetical protein M1817_000404 [Caeruleum heppii]|nr:MAG: hypothetical protein M1817_000404 [Caeruleum heppii]